MTERTPKTISGPATLLLASLALACGGEDDSASGDSGEDGIDLTEGIHATGTTGTSLDDGIFDGTAEDSSGEGQQFRCNAVDFVFVVDNSPSMTDEQQFLAQGVPGFVDAMQNALPNVESVRVGVIDTDSYPGLGTLEDPLDSCSASGVDCSSCDYQLGSLLTKPQSASDPELSCEFSTGAPYMDGTSETFPNEFGCAALVGAVGNPVEQQAGALVAAMSDELNAAEGCNQGFIRDDALLIFLLITDEEDNWAELGGSVGEPAEWFDAVVAIKNGRETNIVALGLLGGSPKFEDCADLSQGVDGAEQSSRLVDFVERFPNHAVGSVCSDGYGPFFQEVLAKVAEGCANFIP